MGKTPSVSSFVGRRLLPLSPDYPRRPSSFAERPFGVSFARIQGGGSYCPFLTFSRRPSSSRADTQKGERKGYERRFFFYAKQLMTDHSAHKKRAENPALY
jgi:hypothetical protein